MWDDFKKYFRYERGLAVVSVFFWLLSFGLIVSAPRLGVAFAAKDGARGFLQKPNWYLFPLFFPGMMWLAYNTWHSYVLGWKSLLTEGVLHTDEYRRVPRDDFGRLARLMKRVRFALLILACALGLVFTTVDSRSAFHLFSPKADSELANPCTDRDFTIAAKIPEYFPLASWTSAIWFAVWAYLVQGALLALGFLCLLQILFHGVLFSFFEKMGLGKKLKLGILLRIDDPNREFGLSAWNNAINQGYIFLAFGMGIPLVSHFSQPFNRPELRTCPPSTGQHLFGLLLWTILAAPTILPVLARFARLRKGQVIVQAANDPTVTDTFEKQRLWPWDKWDVGKLFFGLSILEYLLIANIIDVQKAFDVIVQRFGR
jgi:hypothetical protein